MLFPPYGKKSLSSGVLIIICKALDL